jgi:hypothetical protein
MRAIARACLTFALVLPFAGCSPPHTAPDVEAMKTWTKRCAVEPDDVSGLEAIATGYALKPLLPAEIAALKQRIAAEQTQDPKRPPYVSLLEAWWINQQAGSYVEIVEWRKTSDGTTSIDSKTHRFCMAEGISDSRESFTEQVRLDPAADYEVRTSRNTAIVETSDGASPELSVRFVRNGVRRETAPAAAPPPENVSLAAGLARVSQTLGWPVRWSFSASSSLN